MGEIAVTTFQTLGAMPARVLKVSPDAHPASVVEALAIPPPRALLVLNGGTAPLEEPLHCQLERQLADGVARVAADERYTVVTGGTDAGIFALLGRGVERWGLSAPLIGVAVDELARRPGNPEGEADLEPHHSHFVLVSGRQWGDETAMMYGIVATMSRACPAVTIFAGGGGIVLSEMEANLSQGRPIILLAGSGRATDAVLAARAGAAPENNKQIAAIARSPLIRPFELSRAPTMLADYIREVLSADTNPG